MCKEILFLEKRLSNNRLRKKCSYYDLSMGTLAHTKCCSQYEQFWNILTACLQNGHVVRRSDTTADLSSYRSPCFGNFLGSCLVTTLSLAVSLTGDAKFSSDTVIMVEVSSWSNCRILVSCPGDGSLRPHHFSKVLIDIPSFRASCFFEIFVSAR